MVKLPARHERSHEENWVLTWTRKKAMEMAKSMGASPEALKKMEASMKANKDTSTDASGKPAMAGKTESRRVCQQ